MNNDNTPINENDSAKKEERYCYDCPIIAATIVLIILTITIVNISTSYELLIIYDK